MSEVDINTVKKMFPKISSKNIDSNFEEINSEFDRQTAVLAADKKHGQNLTAEEKRQLALFMYATVRAENASFKAKSESMGPTNSYAFNKLSPQYDTKGHIKKIKFTPELIPASSRYSLIGKPFSLYETGKRQISLGNHTYGDGEKYKGRGYVQLTGRSNYKKYESVVPGLENNPSLADDKKMQQKFLLHIY